jgi:hypothetical protein
LFLLLDGPRAVFFELFGFCGFVVVTLALKLVAFVSTMPRKKESAVTLKDLLKRVNSKLSPMKVANVKDQARQVMLFRKAWLKHLAFTHEFV